MIDIGCTSHMIKGIELFSYLETSQKGEVSCAYGTLQKVALENALHVAQ